MRAIIFGAVALVGATVDAAIAADLPSPGVRATVYSANPPVAPLVSWTACYVGGNIGGGWATTHPYDTNAVITGVAGNPVVNADLGSQSVPGAVAGGQIGCDYQADRFVFGIQGMLDAAHISGSNAQPGGLFTTDTSIPWFAAVTARAGITVVPRGLLYVKAGGAWMKDNLSITVTTGGSPFFGVPAGVAANVGLNASGWTVGAGFEWAFARKWSVFAEYDYLDFGTPNANFTSAGSLLPPTFTLGMRQNVSAFLVGINAHIGPGTF
jgi:outer membrane immunogenic protein